MKEQAELIRELFRELDPMEDDSLTIMQYAKLMVVLTAGPDAETVIDGIHRLMFEIVDRAENLHRQYAAAFKIAKQLDVLPSA